MLSLDLDAARLGGHVHVSRQQAGSSIGEALRIQGTGWTSGRSKQQAGPREKTMDKEKLINHFLELMKL